MREAALFAAIAVVLHVATVANGQSGSGASELQDIRLVNQLGGNFTGRVEVMYRGQWGTICDDYWSSSDASVACRMLGFSGAVCAVSGARFGRGTGSIWMSNLRCYGREESLEDCRFGGWGQHSCHHGEDAGVVCYDDNLLSAPLDVQLIESTTTTLTIGWMSPQKFPSGVTYTRYRVQYESDDYSYPRVRYAYAGTGNRTSFNTTITSLSRGQTYMIQIRAEVRFSYCYSYLYGNYSDVQEMSTNTTLKESNYTLRLVPPSPDTPFMGRVEVFHNGQWGTVCDDYFSYREGHVVCQMLNYTRSLCVVTRAGFGAGTGRIWLDNVRCSSGDEVLEECDHNDWGVHNCDHDDDVGVICVTNEGHGGKVENLSITSEASRSITVSWKQFSFPSTVSYSRYRLTYRSASGSSYSRTISGTVKKYTVSGLSFNTTYNFSIRAEYRFRYCYSYVYGGYSDEVSGFTREAAPTAPPTAFHVVVLSSTIIEVQWNPPPLDDQNGILRGYKLFVRGPDGRETTYDIEANATEYVLSGLEPSTGYVVSVLAYTVADGPRTILLTAVTWESDSIAYISKFGIYGDGIDKVQRYTWSWSRSSIRVLCGSHEPDMQIDWYFVNGTKVGISDRHLREGHYSNGTAVLEIGVDRRLTLCDAGIYTCVANKTDAGHRKRNFTLVINSNAPAPSQPQAVRIGSTWVEVRWDEAECDGGHPIHSFSIEYADNSLPSYSRVKQYVRNIDRTLRTYTLTGLEGGTEYAIRVMAQSSESLSGTWSSTAYVNTLPPAPSAPRDVQVRLVGNDVVEVNWTQPEVSNGHIVHYTIYGFLLVTFEPATRRRRQASTDTSAAIKQIVPSSYTSVNVTVPDTSATYQFQVSASVFYGADENEGELSEISASTTIHVPLPGLPVPQDVRVIATNNASVTLQWNLPPPPVHTITGWRVLYFGSVSWWSRGGILLRLQEKGELEIPYLTRVTISPLTPDTNYLFKISALTEMGEGAEVSLNSRTSAPYGEKLAYFHMRIGRVPDCLTWQNENAVEKLTDLRNSLAYTLNLLCGCGLTTEHIRDEEFSCRGGLKNHVVYRGRVMGNDQYSSEGLVQLMQAWVNNGLASLSVGASRLEVDPSCKVSMDNKDAPDCLSTVPTKPTPSQTSTTGYPRTTSLPLPPQTTSEPHREEEEEDIRNGEIAGIVIGCIIGILLFIFIVLVAILLVRTIKTSRSKKDEDMASFAHLDEVKRSRDSGKFSTPEPPEAGKNTSNF